MKHMMTFFGVMFILLFFFAAGAIEADEYLIGLACAFAGFVSGIMTILLQEKEKTQKSNNLYYEDK